jgi:hypothetical protein
VDLLCTAPALRTLTLRLGFINLRESSEASIAALARLPLRLHALSLSLSGVLRHELALHLHHHQGACRVHLQM